MLDDRKVDDALSKVGQYVTDYEPNGGSGADAYAILREALRERALAVDLVLRATKLIEQKLCGRIAIWFADANTLLSRERRS